MMRRISFTLTLLFAAVIAVTAQAGSDANAGARQQVRVQLKGSLLYVNGVNLTFPTSLDTLTKLLGEPSRTFRGVGAISIWDDLGLIGYQRAKDAKTIKTFSVILNNVDYSPEFYPKKVFAGVLTIDEVKVTPTTTTAELNRSRTAKFGEGSLGSMTVDDMYVLLTRAKGGNLDANGQIVQVWFTDRTRSN